MSPARALPPLLLVLLAACGSAGAEPEASSAPPSTAPEAEREEAPAEPGPEGSPAAAATCPAQLIRRAGLSEAGACGLAIAALTGSPAADRACATDADCAVFAAGGGCLGVSANRVAAASGTRLPASCLGAACESATFDDHAAQCEAGCCVIVEH